MRIFPNHFEFPKYEHLPKFGYKLLSLVFVHVPVV